MTFGMPVLAANLMRGSGGGGGGPSGDVTITVQAFETGTTTGSVDHTSAALAGITPKAVLAPMAWQRVTDEPGESSGAHVGFAVMDDGGTGKVAIAGSRSGQTSTQDWRVHWLSTPRFIIYEPGTTTTQLNAASSIIAGGINLDYGTLAENYRIPFVAFAGSDVLADVLEYTANIASSTLSPGFESDVVIGFTNCYQADNSNDTYFAYSFGVATADGNQRCVVGSEDGAIAQGDPRQAILSGNILAQVLASGAKTYGITASNFTGTSFDIDADAGTGGDDFFFLALNLGGRRSALVDYTTPTSTGSHSVTGVGFTPQFALLILTNLEETDPTFPVGTDDLMSCLSICQIGNEQWSYATRIDSGADPTSTASQLKETAVFLLAPGGGTHIEAALTSFDSDGMTLNYSTVQATGKKGFILFIE